MRPNYLISIGYLKTEGVAGTGGSSEPHWIRNCKPRSAESELVQFYSALFSNALLATDYPFTDIQ